MMSTEKFMLQCTFCYWLSDSVGIHGKSPADLVTKIKEEEHNTNKNLKEEVFNLAKVYRKNVETSMNRRDVLSKYRRRMLDKSKIVSPADPATQKKNAIRKDSDFGIAPLRTQTEDACHELDVRLAEKYKTENTISTDPLPLETAEIDPTFVSNCDLRRVTSLENRLEDTANQAERWSELRPQRVRLITKESYRCPSKKCDNCVLSKPVIGARHASFEVSQLAWDFLPHMALDGPDQLEPFSKTPTKVTLYFANVLSSPCKISVSAKRNENDVYATADVTCSNKTFELAEQDLRRIWPDISSENKLSDDEGNFVMKNMCGINLMVKPKYITDVEFVLEVTLNAKILCSDSNTRPVTIVYPININLGPTKEIDTSRPVDSKPRPAVKKASSPRGKNSTSSRPQNTSAVAPQDGAPKDGAPLEKKSVDE